MMRAARAGICPIVPRGGGLLPPCRPRSSDSAPRFVPLHSFRFGTQYPFRASVLPPSFFRSQKRFSLSLSLSLLLFLLPPVLSGALRPRVTPRPPRKSSVHRNVRRGEVRCYRRPLLRRFRLRRVPFWALLQHECDRMPRDYGLDVWRARQVVHGVMREAWPRLHL